MEDAPYAGYTVSDAKNRNAVGHSKIEVHACAVNDTAAIFIENFMFCLKKKPSTGNTVKVATLKKGIVSKLTSETAEVWDCHFSQPGESPCYKNISSTIAANPKITLPASISGCCL